MKGLGARIAAARVGASLSQAELAGLLGVTQTAVSYWEADRREPDLTTLVALAEVLFTPVPMLLGQQYEHPDTEQALTWWAGWREGWQQCAENARRAVQLDPRRMPPRPRMQPPDDDPIEQQLRHLRYGGPPPDLSDLAPAEREHVQGLLKIVTALADRGPELPPIEDDPVARRLGFADGLDGDRR